MSDQIVDADADGKKTETPKVDPAYAISACARASRSLRGLPMPAAATRASRREVERRLVAALGHLEGSYSTLAGAEGEFAAALQEEGHLLAPPRADTLAAACGGGRDWPDARGAWLAEDKGLRAWVNGPDHLLLAATDGAGRALAKRRQRTGGRAAIGGERASDLVAPRATSHFSR